MKFLLQDISNNLISIMGLLLPVMASWESLVCGTAAELCIVFWRTCGNRRLDVYDRRDLYAALNMPGRSTLGVACRCLTMHRTISAIWIKIHHWADKSQVSHSLKKKHICVVYFDFSTKMMVHYQIQGYSCFPSHIKDLKLPVSLTNH